jgi:hypothetical protein
MKKQLLTIVFCLIIFSLLMSGAYYAGYNIGSSKADAKYQMGFNAGVLDAGHGDNLAQARVSQAYQNGYQAGLKAQSNSTGTG